MKQERRRSSPSDDRAPMRLAVVGLGEFGLLHARTIQSLAECELAAIVEVNPQRRKIASDEFPQTRSYESVSQANEQADIDGWVIASSTASHIPLAKQLLAAGGRVLIEKPLATTLSDAESIREWVASDSSNLMMGHIALFGSEFRALVEQTRQRSPIRYLSAVRHRPQTTIEAYPDESPLYLTMVHDLYCVQVLMQRREPIAFRSRQQQNGQGKLCLACAELLWEDAIASFTASFLAPSGMPEEGFDRLEVFGDGWGGRIEPNPRPLQLWDDRPRYPLTLEIQQHGKLAVGMLAEELRSFCRVLRGEKVPLGTTYADALQIQCWLENLSSEFPK